jgi:adenylate cyclase
MPKSADPVTRSMVSKSGRPQLAAVAVADIVGYSILMSTEGEATHERWMTLFHGTLRPLAQKHGCTFLKSTGDGVVVQFPSVVDAYAWAETVQHATHATDVATLPPIAFRIAIDYGEMHQTADDIYGNVVNVAATAGTYATGRRRSDEDGA